MSTIGQVNNRNQRLIAFFKAAILYLCTIPLLIFIIRNNVKNPIPSGNESTGNESSFQQIKADNDALEQMIFYIDNVATLTKELVALDEQEFENRGSKKGEIDKTELKIKRLYEKIQDIKISKNLEDNRDKIDNIYAILAENEGKIDELRSNNVEAEDDNEELLEQMSDNNETAAAETEEAHEEEVAGLEEQIEDKDDEIEDLNEQIAERDNELAAEREKVADMKTKKGEILSMVKDIKTTIQTEKGNLGAFRDRCRRLVDAVEPQVYQLETFVKD